MPTHSRGTTRRARAAEGRAWARGLRLLLVLGWLLGGCLVEGLDGDGFGATCQPHFEGAFSSCAPSCNASNVVLIDGVRYCTQQCAPDNTCPVGHVCIRFAPGDRPESACLPPCRTGADCPSGFLGLCSAEGICGL